MRSYFCLIICAAVGAMFSRRAVAAEHIPAHGMWVWKSSAVLAAPQGAEKLRDFSQSAGINEVYVSVSGRGDVIAEDQFSHLIAVLHRSHVRVEALLSSEDAEEPGAHREKVLVGVNEILKFNLNHPANQFDGIHLDIEPQRRPENQGASNLIFLPGLVDAYRAIRARAERPGLPVDADIQSKILKGNLAQRRVLLSSLPRLTLMLYQLSNPGDGESTARKSERLRAESQRFFDMAYRGLSDPQLAKLIIAIRTADYGKLLPQMLSTLDAANRSNPHYAGWAQHSYNDYLNASH